MKRFFTSIFLFLLSGLAFADSAWNTPGLPTPVSNHTDLSVAYLAQIFGTVGDTLQGTSGQMLGMLFSKLNEGIMVVAGLWLIYTIITMILRAAMDGSFMGQNKNAFWIIIRVAIGFAMLIPGPITGYNIIQDVVMKVVVEGVSLADQTWSYGLGYIHSGGTLWRTPSETGGGWRSGQSIISDSQAKTMLSRFEPIFRSEVCMVASSMANTNQKSQSGGNGVANTGSSAVLYHIVENDKNTTFNFPGVGNGKDFSEKISNGEKATCGAINWSQISGVKGNAAGPQLAKAAVSQVVYALLPAAKKYACLNYSGGGSVCSGVNTTNVTEDNQTSTFTALVNYVNSVFPLAQAENDSSAKLAESFIGDAMNSGWMMAGRYYWDLSQIAAYRSAVTNISNYAPATQAILAPAIEGNDTLKDFIATQSGGQASNLGDAWNNYTQGALKQLATYRDTSSKGHTGDHHTQASKNAAIGGLTLVLRIFLGHIWADIISLFALFNTQSGVIGMGPDPISFLHMVGMKCIAISGDIWIDLASAIFGLATISMFCQSLVDAWTPISATIGWMKPPMMMLATALMGVGVMLGYYVPLYPFMLFTFGVIGWLISVIEAMVAAPLIAFGLTHPEGHDFLGEAKQALTLLLGVFLRPVLMVIGLIAGMILSYVSLRILVYTYSGFLQDIFYTIAPISGSSGSVLAGATMASINAGIGGALSSGTSGLMMGLTVFPLMLAIFAALVYVVTNQCFSLIYVLPDYVLRWIGAPVQSSQSAEMAKQVQGISSQLASTSGEGGKSGMQAKMQENQHDGGYGRNWTGNAPQGGRNESTHNTNDS